MVFRKYKKQKQEQEKSIYAILYYVHCKIIKISKSYLKKIYGDKYIYYHSEYIKNNAGKIKEIRIVKNNDNEKYENPLDLIFTREDGTYTGTDITRTPFKIIHNELGIEKCRFTI